VFVWLPGVAATTASTPRCAPTFTTAGRARLQREEFVGGEQVCVDQIVDVHPLHLGVQAADGKVYQIVLKQ
jgi:hypothetical protein